jgi:energy-coupling factor transporter transmembrane protein EcfT
VLFLLQKLFDGYYWWREKASLNPAIWQLGLGVCFVCVQGFVSHLGLSKFWNVAAMLAATVVLLPLLLGVTKDVRKTQHPDERMREQLRKTQRLIARGKK